MGLPSRVRGAIIFGAAVAAGLYVPARESLTLAMTNELAGARAYVADGVLLFAPRMPRTMPHACCAATVLVGLDGPLRLRGPDCSGHEAAVVLAPNARYANGHAGGTLALLVDPDDPAYRFIHPVLGGATLRELDPAVAADLRDEARVALARRRQCHALRDLAQRVLVRLCPRPLAVLPWDPRVLRACQYIRAALPQRAPRSADLAAAVGLSHSRFLHLFQEQMGMPLRKYLLWLRVRCALGLGGERTLAGVALGSGFYDQAHFTRTIRRMTGHAPSLLFARTLERGAAPVAAQAAPTGAAIFPAAPPPPA
jgi:AraC family transcriptional regulator, arabinose operon regulatory protein